MTLSPCDQVAERLALGDPLAELSEHAASCAHCQGLVSVSSQLGATRHAVDPGLGFSARMTVGAQHRIGVRRRRRLALGLAATVASGVVGVFVVTHAPPAHRAEPAMAQLTGAIKEGANDHGRDPSPDPWRAKDSDPDADLTSLVQLADVDRASRLSARWNHIKKPLSPYKKLLKGVLP